MHPTPETPGETEAPGAAPVAAPRAERPGPTRIVGIGASAGGREAFEQFFPALPSDSGLAYVVIQHRDPTKKGALAELVRRTTPLPVVEAGDGMAIEPDHVYVVPASRFLTVERGRCRLHEIKTSTHIQTSVDALFRSLAEDQRDRAAGVVLSGMGTDGTLGIGAIKDQLGLVLVQDPATAQFDGMPQSAAATGLADHVAPAAELPGLLLGHLESGRSTAPARKPSSAETTARILALVRAGTGHDFSLYKTNSVHRRIRRRMTVLRLERLGDYLQLLQQDPAEVDLLLRELMIGATQFFRDPGAWDALRDRALPGILGRKPPDGEFRAWVPGCSTGEEAFSLAIVLLEALEAAGDERRIPVQIFATDIDGEAIAAARRGLYPPKIEADVSAGRLGRFFVRQEDGRYRVGKEVRELVVFGEQNVVMDPPFIRLDLLSCRNLLIYFSAELQRRVLPIFHYSLLPDGILFLGSSETVGSPSPFFAPVRSPWKFFRRTGGRGAYPESFAVPRATQPPELARARRLAGKDAPGSAGRSSSATPPRRE